MSCIGVHILIHHHLCLLRALLLDSAGLGRLALFELDTFGESGGFGQASTNIVFLLDGKDSHDPVL